MHSGWRMHHCCWATRLTRGGQPSITFGHSPGTTVGSKQQRGVSQSPTGYTLHIRSERNIWSWFSAAGGCLCRCLALVIPSLQSDVENEEAAVVIALPIRPPTALPVSGTSYATCNYCNRLGWFVLRLRGQPPKSEAAKLLKSSRNGTKTVFGYRTGSSDAVRAYVTSCDFNELVYVVGRGRCMSYFTVTLVAVCLCVAAPSTHAQAPATQVPASMPAVDTLVDVFVPRAMMFALSRELCNTAFRTSLEVDPNLRLAEKDIPLLTERMVTTASAHCDAEMPKLLDRRQAEAREHVLTSLKPADQVRLARVLEPRAQKNRSFKIDARPGDTMPQIIARTDTVRVPDAREQAAYLAFAKTAGGVALLKQTRDYQEVMDGKLIADRGALLEIADAGYLAAHRQANLMAAEKGFGELYSDAPVPRPIGPAPVGAVGDSVAKIGGASVYVYSFLDVRQDEFTPKVLDNFDAALTSRFNGTTVSSKILRYAQAKQAAGQFAARRSLQGSDNQMIPVAETILRNRADEESQKADYRLIIFPSNFVSSGAWRAYEIKFVLVNIANNQTVLDYTYQGRHMVVFKESENADGRTNKILESFFVEMRSKGLT